MRPAAKRVLRRMGDGHPRALVEVMRDCGLSTGRASSALRELRQDGRLEVDGEGRYRVAGKVGRP